jgi:hypothetical protein
VAAVNCHTQPPARKETRVRTPPAKSDAPALGGPGDKERRKREDEEELISVIFFSLPTLAFPTRSLTTKKRIY